MTDITTFTAVLSSLKMAADIAKTLKDSDLNLERAEMKLKVAELVGTLADAKISMVDLQELLRDKDQEIERLTKAMALTGEVVKRGDAYFLKDEEGGAKGAPFCLHCWESKRSLAHLIRRHERNSLECMHCPTCKTNYGWANIAWP